MYFNLISACSFVLMIFLSAIIEKTKKSEIILRSLSLVLFVYKSIYYIVQNIKGNLSVPVEISSITYFLMFIILIFKIKSLYGVGSFYGIMAGLGYFTFYTLFGFTVAESFSIKELLIGCFSHGFVFVSGMHLYKTNKFSKIDKLKVWITIFAMLSWALVFYDIEMRGITFIYYIIKPKFLFVFENMSLNVILMIAYYTVLVTAFYFVIKIFFRLNNKLKVKTLEDKIKYNKNQKANFSYGYLDGVKNYREYGKQSFMQHEKITTAIIRVNEKAKIKDKNNRFA